MVYQTTDIPSQNMSTIVIFTTSAGQIFGIYDTATKIAHISNMATFGIPPKTRDVPNVRQLN